MRLGLCRRNAENRGAGPVPSFRGAGGCSFPFLDASLFSFGPRFVPDLAPVLLWVSSDWPSEFSNPRQHRRINLPRAGRTG